MRLRTILFAGFILLSVLPVLILSLWVQKTSLDNEIGAVHEKHLLVARNLTNALSRYAADTRTLFEFSIAMDTTFPNDQPTRTAFSSLHFEYICISSPEGNLIRKIYAGSESELPVPKTVIETLASQPGNDTIFFDLMPAETSKPLLFLGKRLENGNLAIGSFNTTYLIKMQKAITFGKLGHAAIVDGSGQVLAHPKSEWQGEMKNISKVKPVALMQTQSTGVSMFYSPAVKADMIAGFSVVPETGWGAMIPQPVSELEQHAYEVRLASLLVGAAGIIFAVALGWWLSGILASPLRSVAETAKSVSDGNLDSQLPVLTGFIPREANQMANAFSSMVSDLIQKNQEVEDKTRILQVTMDNMAEGIVLVDPKFNVLLHNRQLLILLKISEDVDLINQPIGSVFNTSEDLGDWLSSVDEDTETRELQHGGNNFLELRCNSLTDGCLVITCVDVTVRKNAEARIQYLATHDTLTGLPNRHAFDEALSQLIRKYQNREQQIYLLYMDLDRFKEVNDSLGHELGDRLLQSVGKRIVSLAGNHQLVARLGGDEFAVLMSPNADRDHAVEVSEALTAGLIKKFTVDGHEIYIRTSLGITTFPNDGRTPGELLKKADLAMYTAKSERSGGYSFYRDSMAQDLSQRKEKEQQLRLSITNQEFVLHYQPICDAVSQEIVGLEALIRWKRNGDNLVFPDEFIPIAEDTGLIIPIGAWVMEEVTRQISTWQNNGIQTLPVAVNLSAVQFRQEDLSRRILDTLSASSVAPELLVLEITENTALSNEQQVLSVVKQLAEHGIKLSMDDFGTGYSSLSHLRQFPVRKVKIDKSFVLNIGLNPDDTNIVSAIIELSHSLGLPTIAEGVENVDQLSFLCQAGCDQVQGHFLYPAQSSEDITTLLRSKTSS